MSRDKLYLDHSLPLSDRIAHLMREMTLAEKCGQLQYEYINLEEQHLDSSKIDDWVTRGLGSFFVNSQLPAGDTARNLNKLQACAQTKTRLGIPALVHCESLHGLLSNDTTVFPQSITLAASFDRELVENTFEAIAKEVRSRGMHVSYSPVLDLGTDPRWGRVQETFGEDPYLVSEMGVACVKGYQARGGRFEHGKGFCVAPEDDGIDRDHVICTAKHFAGYGQAQGGRNFGPYNDSKQFFLEHVLLPFRKAVQQAGLLAIMPGHHDVEGVPCHANRWLLNDVLREEWGFDGVIVSDADDVIRLKTLHHVAPDMATSTRLAMQAGLDIEILHSNCFLKLEDYVRDGTLEESLIDTAVERVLSMKFQLGLFEDPLVEEAIAVQSARSDDHQKIAQMAAEGAAVLLKNSGGSSQSGALPLNVEQIKTVALIGPTAANLHYGSYSPNSVEGTSIRDGLAAYNDARGNPIEITWASGCRITHTEEEDYETEDDMARARKNPQPVSDADNAEDIASAVALARTSDVVILCVGGNRFTERESVFMSGHRGDRGSIRLVGSQERLIHEVAAAGTPVILVVSAGGPIELTEVVDEVDAILWAGYSGARTGEAIAGILFGETNPSGKLPITFPRSVAHLPCYYYQKPMANFKEYLFEESSPLFPFGFGLSYTTFKYSDLKLKSHIISAEETVDVTVTVSNTGNKAGKEIVQLYVSDDYSSITRPVKELKDFAKMELEPGESCEVMFTITFDTLAFTNAQMKRVVEPGTFTVTIGPNSIHGLTATLEVLDSK